MPPWSTRYPELVHILEGQPMAPLGVVISTNIFVSCKGIDDIRADAKPYLTMKENLLDAPPSVLQSSQSGIPQVNEADPSVKGIGFQPIPYAQIGIIQTPAADLNKLKN